MSYYLLAFDPAAVTDADFSAWWAAQSAWGGSHDYNSPDSAGPAVRPFFDELIQTFPPMNGPLAAADDYEPADRVTDYSIAPDFIYAAFAWSESDAAGDLFAELAEKYGLAMAAFGEATPLIIRPEVAAPKKKWPWSK